MILDKLKRKAVQPGVSRPRGNSPYMIILFLEDKSKYLDVETFFAPFDIEIVIFDEEVDKLENIFNLYFKSKIYVIVDNKKVSSDEDFKKLSDVTRGRSGVMVIGDNTEISYYWKMKESGFDEYTSFESESKVPFQMVLKYFGIFKKSSSHRFLITDTIQNNSGKFLHYLYDNLETYTNKRPGLKTLIISLDLLSVSLDAKIGKKTDSKILDLLSNPESIDKKIIDDYVIEVTDNLSYFSIDLLGGEGHHTFEELVKEINMAINLLESDYSYIFYYVPFYMTKTGLYKLLVAESDNLTLVTDSSLESVYMLKNIIENDINVANIKKHTKLFGVQSKQKKSFELDDKNIYKKIGMKFNKKYDLDRSGINLFKRISGEKIIEDVIKL